MEPEIDQVAIPADEWREMLAAAAVLDLVHGGYYRVRARTIQFYCSPDNAPDGWDHPYPDGTPEAARALVGAAEVAGREGENELLVRLTVSNWAAVREVKQAFDRGEYRERFQQYVMDQEAALRGRSEDRVWLRQELQRLRNHAMGTLVERG